MTNLITTFLNICLLREGPDVLPSSLAFLATIIVISLGVSILIGSMVYDVTGAMLTSIAGLFLSFVFVRLLLLKRPERFLQTFSAMLGTVTLINIISLPASYSMRYLKLGHTAEMFFGLTAFALFVWIVIVYGHIFSKALSCAMSYGIAISVGYALLQVMMLEMFVSGNMHA
ncbi:MAG: hypothetical protein OXC42_01855 [Gammaproteobacteria bacterium]|nr:hypothetical protein [Gammaproteobacteria bacterium]